LAFLKTEFERNLKISQRDYEDDSLLGYGTVWSRRIRPTATIRANESIAPIMALENCIMRDSSFIYFFTIY
jgi:hypothetical protein